jgi:dTDP-4-amino-4,6-dideoxygalactose transaminase
VAEAPAADDAGHWAVHREEHSLTIGLRYLAPAGAPIRLPDLARWARVALSSSDAAEVLRQVIRDRFGVRHCALTSTGRAGLTLLLRAMRRLAAAGRDEVVLPSYTCYSVAASIAKAGLRPRLVDIRPDTLDYAPEAIAQTDFSRVVALIATNLYGMPSDLPGLAAVARRHGVFLIDDAAQSMGASVGGRWSGTWGDAGLFSFDKGKNVSAIDGGMVVTSSEDLARALRLEMADLPTAGAVASGFHIVKALAYFTLLRPWLYGIPTKIPQLALGKTVYTTDFPLQHSDPSLVALGLVMMRRLDDFTRARQLNAAAWLDGLRGISGLQTVVPGAGTTPVYLRLPVLFPDAASRDAAITGLTAAGIGATASYPHALADVPEVRQVAANPSEPAAGSRLVAARIVTLPTHPFVTRSDINRTVALIQRKLGSRCTA